MLGLNERLTAAIEGLDAETAKRLLRIADEACWFTWLDDHNPAGDDQVGKFAFTYTLASEPGSSLRAAGFVVDAVIPERDWSAESGRDRYAENLFGERRTPEGPKIRWRRDLIPQRQRAAA